MVPISISVVAPAVQAGSAAAIWVLHITTVPEALGATAHVCSAVIFAVFPPAAFSTDIIWLYPAAVGAETAAGVLAAPIGVRS